MTATAEEMREMRARITALQEEVAALERQIEARRKEKRDPILRLLKQVDAEMSTYTDATGAETNTANKWQSSVQVAARQRRDRWIELLKKEQARRSRSPDSDTMTTILVMGLLMLLLGALGLSMLGLGAWMLLKVMGLL